MKVLKTFKCVKSGKKFVAGDDYKGDRLKEFQASGLVSKPKKKTTTKK